MLRYKNLEKRLFNFHGVRFMNTDYGLSSTLASFYVSVGDNRVFHHYVEDRYEALRGMECVMFKCFVTNVEYIIPVSEMADKGLLTKYDLMSNTYEIC